MRLTAIAAVLIAAAAKLIKNAGIPSCSRCAHYIPTPYDEFASSFGQCALFGQQDFAGDRVIHSDVLTCRMDEARCGVNATLFEPEPNLAGKVAKHWGRKYLRIFLVVALVPLLHVIYILALISHSLMCNDYTLGDAGSVV